MSVEQNKALVRRFLDECWSQGNVKLLEELVDRNVVLHNPFGNAPPNRDGWQQTIALLRTAFPDIQLTVEDAIAEGDKVVARELARGTNRGPFMGRPPTGKPVTIAGIHIYRIAGDKIVEHWGQVDVIGMMQQLGANPMPGQSSS